MSAGAVNIVGSKEVTESSGRAIPAVPAIFLFALALGFVGTLAIQLPNIRLHQVGVSSVAIGFSTAFQATGIVIGAISSLLLLRLAGTAMLISGGCVLAGLSLLALGLADGAAWISAWRCAMAIGTGIVLTTAEYVLMARAPVNKRATSLAAYATFGLLGNALAPATIAFTGAASPTPLFAAALIMTALAALPHVANIRNRIEPGLGKFSDLRLVLLYPALFVPALAFGLIDGGLVEMMNIYLLNRNMSVSFASIVAMSVMIGAIGLQIPVAMISDRYGHGRILVTVWTIIVLALGVIHFGQLLWVLVAAAFVLGGACDALYSIGFTALADKLPAGRMAAANGCFVALCGTGEICGPLLGGSAFQIANGAGFILVFMLAGCAGLILALRPEPSWCKIDTDRRADRHRRKRINCGTSN